MKRIALLLGLAAVVALASERPLGTTYSGDGGTANNQYTSTPFVVPNGALLTVQCEQDSYVNADVTVCTPAACVKIPVGAALTTSCSSSGGYNPLPDGGSYTRCIVANAPADGGVSKCYWFQRTGNEGS